MLAVLLAVLGIDFADKALNTQTGKYDVDEWGMYVDGNGTLRLKKNGKSVVDTYNDFGDKVIKYAHSGIVAVNIDEIESKQRKQDAIDNNRKFYMYRPDRDNYPKFRCGRSEIRGNRYCSVDGGGLYVVRHIEFKDLNDESEFNCWYNGDYYMDMDYKICMPTEEQKEKDTVQFGDKAEALQKHIIDTANKHIKMVTDGCNINCFNEDYTIHIGDASNTRYDMASVTVSHWK